MEGEKFQCMFCATTVYSKDQDFCILELKTNWDQPDEVPKEQDFFCHAKCFRKAAHPKTPLYILDKWLRPGER